MAGEDTETAEPEVIITIEDETHGADAAVKTEIKDPAVNDLVEQYKRLEARDAANQQAKDAAERRAADSAQDAARARQEADAARTAVTASNLDTITTALNAATAEIDAAERDYKIAAESGDATAMAASTRRMAKAEALILRYDEAKSDIEARKAAPTPERRTSAPDPVEAYVQGRTEPTARWLREHREFVTDPRKNAKLTSAHWDAVGEGIALDTPEYFSHVEQFIGIGKAADTVVTAGDDVARPGAVQQQPAVRRPAARQVAPVAGSGGNGGAGGAQTVRLTPGEAAAATDGTHQWNYDDPSPQKKFRKGDPIGTQEFARRKLALTKQGAYDRTFTDS